MNILPKKSWHVRTKQNIARVRRDEAKAAEEEKETQRRIALAAQESRTALLRERASKRLAGASAPSEVEQEENGEVRSVEAAEEVDTRFGLPLASLRDVVQADGHVNFFQDVEGGKRQGGVNDEYEDEKRKEQEDYEKKIGYLVYLGQDSIEHSKNKPWYSKIDRGKPKELEKELENEKDKDKAAGIIGGLEEKSKTLSIEEIRMTKFKSFLDPLKDIRKHLTAPGVKRKLDSFPSSSKSFKKTDSLLPPPSKKLCVEEVSKKSKKEKHKKHKHKSSKKSKKHKKHRKHSKSKDGSESGSSSWESEDSEEEKKRSKLEQLRAERLQREREERRKAEKVLAKLRGEPEPEPPQQKSSNNYDSRERPESSVKQKYNSQFNPHLARQNYDYQ
ncbi:Leukocyte receptor cluster member 1 [Orchesella cincta]|uniref:Leukocyte receptor cluster member 1 n=1 Tax=Orchesella cincta TaxID=48709 RepID=A0A1D2NHH4_ORCCI|nr:Leukocyte receptor cluster member 1 [Orchesella cincta]